MNKSEVAYVSPELTSNRESSNTTSAGASGTVSVEAYERMCRALYAYRFGSIGFLDLLARWEETLGIKPPQANE